MEYEIIRISDFNRPTDIDGIYDNPESARIDLEDIRKKYPGRSFGIRKDGAILTDSELNRDIDIQEARSESIRLPASYRTGRATDRDDVALGIDGNPTVVWAPDNPEDRYV